MRTKCLYAETPLGIKWINIIFPLLQRRHKCNLQNGIVETGWVKPGQLEANGAARIISNNRCEALLGEIQQAFYFLVEGKLGNEAILK